MMQYKYKILEKTQQSICKLDDIKNYLRISHTYDDTLINKLILSAIDAAENFLRVSLTPKLILFTVHSPGQKLFQLLYKPVIKISSILIQHKNTDQSITDLKYELHETNGILSLQKALQAYEILVLQYLSGFEEIEIPNAIQHGIFMHISEMYEREEITASGLSQEIKNLYQPYRSLKI